MLIAEETCGRPVRHFPHPADHEDEYIENEMTAVTCRNPCCNNSSATADDIRYLPQVCPTPWTRITIQKVTLDKSIDDREDLLVAHVYPAKSFKQFMGFRDLHVSTLLNFQWWFLLAIKRVGDKKDGKIVGVINEATGMEVDGWQQIVEDLGLEDSKKTTTTGGDESSTRKPDYKGNYVYMIRRVDNPNFNNNSTDGVAQSKFRLELLPTDADIRDRVFKRKVMCPNLLLLRNKTTRRPVTRHTPHPIKWAIEKHRYVHRDAPTRWVPVIVTAAPTRPILKGDGAKPQDEELKFMVKADTDDFHYDEINMVDICLTPLIPLPAGMEREFEVRVRLNHGEDDEDDEDDDQEKNDGIPEGKPEKEEEEKNEEEAAKSKIRRKAMARGADVWLLVEGWEKLLYTLVFAERSSSDSSSAMAAIEATFEAAYGAKPIFTADDGLKLSCRRVSIENNTDYAVEFALRNPPKEKTKISELEGDGSCSDCCPDCCPDHNKSADGKKAEGEGPSTNQDGNTTTPGSDSTATNGTAGTATCSGTADAAPTTPEQVMSVYPGSEIEQVESPEIREQRRVRFSRNIQTRTLPPPPPPDFD